MSNEQNATSKPTRILIADDHEMVRVGLRVLVDDLFPGVEVVEAFSFESARTALSGTAGCDLAMIDLNMPGMDGVAGVQALRQLHPDLRLVVVSGADSPEAMLGCLDAGANGFIEKAAPGRIVEQALALVLAGGTYVPQGAVSGNRVRGSAEAELGPGAAGHLTPRQRDVLRLLSLGKSNKEIARDLDLSEGTVKVHMTAILKAMGARNRGHAIVLASKAVKE